MPSLPPHDLSDQKLEPAARRVCWERDQCFAACDRLRTEAADAVTRNAYLESFLTHVRNLHDFFLGMPNKDDILASHFLPAGQWDPVNIKARVLRRVQELADRGGPINKRLSHLTYASIDSDPNFADIRWQPEAPLIRKELLGVFDHFAALLRVHRPQRAMWFGPDPRLYFRAGAYTALLRESGSISTTLKSQ